LDLIKILTVCELGGGSPSAMIPRSLKNRSRQHFVDTYRGASFVPYKFLGMLRDRRIVAHKTVPIVSDPREIVVDAFRQYLSQERGLSVSTQCNYTRFAHQFLRERFGRGSLELSALSATDVTGFIRRQRSRAQRP
jgi:integrase/recombinase XerD